MSDKILERFMSGIMFACGLGLLGIFVVVAVSAPLLAISIVAVLGIVYVIGYIIELLGE